MENAWLILVAFIAYCLGSISPAFLKFGRKVIEGETGIAGAMTVFRTAKAQGYPLKVAIFWLMVVILADGSKAVVAIAIARWGLISLGYSETLGVLFAALFAVLGHNHSLHLKLAVGQFRGGRGISSVWGAVWLFSWAYALLSLAVLLTVSYLVEWAESRLTKREMSRSLNKIVLGRLVGLGVAVALGWTFIPLNCYLALLPAVFLMLASNSHKLIRHYQRMNNQQAVPD